MLDYGNNVFENNNNCVDKIITTHVVCLVLSVFLFVPLSLAYLMKVLVLVAGRQAFFGSASDASAVLSR